MNCVPPFSPNSYVETLLQSYVGEGGLWEVIRVRYGHEGGALMTGLVPLLEEIPDLDLSLCHVSSQ